MPLIIVIAVVVVLAVGAAAWVVQRRRHLSESASALDETARIRKSGNTSAVRLLRSDDDVSQALERANASSVRIAADIASRRYARFAVAPLHDDAA
jgi:uncharacterized membrane protein affecting hemolysin expression